MVSFISKDVTRRRIIATVTNEEVVPGGQWERGDVVRACDADKDDEILTGYFLEELDVGEGSSDVGFIGADEVDNEDCRHGEELFDGRVHAGPNGMDIPTVLDKELIAESTWETVSELFTREDDDAVSAVQDFVEAALGILRFVDQNERLEGRVDFEVVRSDFPNVVTGGEPL